jgi:hypothetical protein
MKKILALFFLIGLCSPTYAGERFDCTMTYVNTRAQYEGECLVYSGFELNVQGGGYAGYEPMKAYVVFPWRQGQATVVKLDDFICLLGGWDSCQANVYGGYNSNFPWTGSDKQNRRWQIN